MKNRGEDLTGKTFGRLTVVEPAPRSVTPKGRKLPRWWCMCDCGNRFNVLHDSLKRGAATSCGCTIPSLLDKDIYSDLDLFIHKSRETHGNKYDYSKVSYKGSKDRVIIVCPEHGAFLQKPNNHIQGTGCSKCAGVYVRGRNDFINLVDDGVCPKHGVYHIPDGCKDCKEESQNIKVESFIEDCRKVHGDFYDYSKVRFEVRKDLITVICPDHVEFSVKGSEHLSGTDCPLCREERYLRKRFETFVNRSRETHGDAYDYSLVDYKRSDIKVKILCPNHGVFEQKPNSHINGNRCPKCSLEERSERQHWNQIERCKRNPKLGRSDGYLYLVKLCNNEESLLKVGVSVDLDDRLKRFEEYDYEVTVLKTHKTIALNSALKERKLLDYIRDTGARYTPKTKFKGWTECADISRKGDIERIFQKIIKDDIYD